MFVANLVSLCYTIITTKGDALSASGTTGAKGLTMKISKYEKFKNEAILAFNDAIEEENVRGGSGEYVVVIRNVTDGYNVDFTHTTDGSWADEVYEQSCDIILQCARFHKGSKYIVIFAKHYQNGYIDLIKESHLCF